MNHKKTKHLLCTAKYIKRIQIIFEFLKIAQLNYFCECLKLCKFKMTSIFFRYQNVDWTHKFFILYP